MHARLVQDGKVSSTVSLPLRVDFQMLGINPIQVHQTETARASMTDRTNAAGGNRSRERMKQEAAYLRETVAELELRLAQMRPDNVDVKPHDAMDPTRRAQAIANAVWQDIAERQRQLRYAAEVENNKLREFLEGQIRLGKSLEKLLHRRQHAEVESMLTRRLDTHPTNVSTEQSSPLDSANLRHDLIACLSAQLVDSSAVFERECFSNDHGPFRHIDLRYRDDFSTYVETTERRFLPFDVPIVADAVLHQLTATVNPRAVAVQDSTILGTLFEYNLTSMVDTTRFRGILRTKLFLQRIDKEGSIDFLFAGLSDPGEALGSSCEGMYIRHRGWMRVRALPLPVDDSSNPSLTEHATYHVATPEMDAIVPDQKRKIGTLINYVLAAMSFQMDLGRESIDNYLLANAVKTTASEPLLSRNHESSCWDPTRHANPPPSPPRR